MEKILAGINKNDYEDIVKRAISEDLGAYGDITSKYIFSEKDKSSGFILCKEKSTAVLCGISIVEYIFHYIDPDVEFESIKKDGRLLEAGEKRCTVHGKTTSILKSERVSLNFLAHLSAIATLTKKFSDIASIYGVKVAETRKTLPNLRVLEKFAVRCGGGFNHRFGLYD